MKINYWIACFLTLTASLGNATTESLNIGDQVYVQGGQHPYFVRKVYSDGAVELFNRKTTKISRHQKNMLGRTEGKINDLSVGDQVYTSPYSGVYSVVAIFPNGYVRIRKGFGFQELPESKLARRSGEFNGVKVGSKVFPPGHATSATVYAIFPTGDLLVSDNGDGEKFLFHESYVAKTNVSSGNLSTGSPITPDGHGPSKVLGVFNDGSLSILDNETNEVSRVELK